MKKLAEEFSNVKRSALVVSSKAPFFEWVQSIYPDEDNSAVYQDPDVYLLPDYETPEEMERWLFKVAPQGGDYLINCICCWAN